MSDPNYAREELLEKVMVETRVKADLYEAFGPLVDFSKGSLMGFLDRKIAQRVMRRTSGETGVELDMNGRNDLRDWEKVRGFAQRFRRDVEGLPGRLLLLIYSLVMVCF